MPLTPNDILQKRFGAAFRGLSPDEVYAYLRSVAAELEEALREASRAKDALARLEEQVEEFRHMEQTLRNTLISSQKVGQEIRQEAEHQADLITREAHIEAERIVHAAERKRQALEQQLLRLLAQRRRFRAEFGALIETHVRLLRDEPADGELDLVEDDPRQLAFEDVEAAEGPRPGPPAAAAEPPRAEERHEAPPAPAPTPEHTGREATS